MATYAEYCPIAAGAECLADRWTLLILRESMLGAHRFNDIHRGIPRISRTLLAQRLRQLERWGIVVRHTSGRGRSGSYTLTEMGEALTPIVWAMGHWAAEWCFADPTDEDCDGLSLIWRLHQHAVLERMPAQRTFVHVVLTGTNGAEGWLEVGPTGITVCRDDQGHDIDLAVQADTRQMHRWMFGRVTFRELVSTGQARLLGPSRLARAFPTWFDISSFSESFARAESHRAIA